MDEWLFEVLDRDGALVSLSAQRWSRHIMERHPELRNNAEALKAVIQDPMIVTLDNGGVHHLSTLGAVKGKWRGLYLEVVVRYTASGGEVLTAFFNGDVPKGELQWLRKT